MRRLEQAGVIQGYSARLNPDALVKRTPVWVQIELKQHNAESFARFEALVRDTPEVTECVAVGGGVDYLLKVEADSVDAYQRLIDEWLTSDVGIERYFTYIVTKAVKQKTPSSAPKAWPERAPEKRSLCPKGQKNRIAHGGDRKVLPAASPYPVLHEQPPAARSFLPRSATQRMRRV